MSTNIYEAIQQERKRQDDKWGEQNHGDLYWLGILMEEVGEIAKSVIEAPLQEGGAVDQSEIVQAATVCVAWLEAIARRKAEWVSPMECSMCGADLEKHNTYSDNQGNRHCPGCGALVD